jgi:hypothetical protein
MTNSEEQSTAQFQPCPDWCARALVPEHILGADDATRADTGAAVRSHEAAIPRPVPTTGPGVQVSWGGEETIGLGWLLSIRVSVDDVAELTAGEARVLATRLLEAAAQLEAAQR